MKTKPLGEELVDAGPERKQVLMEAIRLVDALMKFCDDNDIGRFRQQDEGDGEICYIPQREKR